MARIAGINIPDRKHAVDRVDVDLRYRSTACVQDLRRSWCGSLRAKIMDLTEEEVEKLRGEVASSLSKAISAAMSR